MQAHLTCRTPTDGLPLAALGGRAATLVMVAAWAGGCGVEGAPAPGPAGDVVGDLGAGGAEPASVGPPVVDPTVDDPPVDDPPVDDPPVDDPPVDDPPVDDPPVDDPPVDDPPVDDPPVDDPGMEVHRSLAWVRTHPMFISGLCVSTGPPTPAEVAAYHEGFGANAVHLWANGLAGDLEGWRRAGRQDLRWVSWVLNDGHSAAGGGVIGGVPAGLPGRIGYQIGDEPGLHGDTMEDMAAITLGAEAVRAADPGGLIIVNFSLWADDLDQAVDHFVEVMNGDVISYDRYTFSRDAYRTLAYFRAAGLRHGRPYWRYLDSYDDVGEADWPGEVDMRWDAFTGLVYGYTGHTWFVYQANAPHQVASSFFPRQGDLSGAPTQRWEQAARLNRQMAHLGRAVTQLTSIDVRYIPAFSLLGFEQPLGTEAWAPGAGADPYITAIRKGGDLDEVLVGFFEDDAGEGYVMLQNPNRPRGAWPNNRADAMTLSVDFDFAGAPDAFDPSMLRAMDKDTGAIVALPLRATGDTTSTLDVTLAAGDVVFFKYATGAPFALGPAGP